VGQALHQAVALQRVHEAMTLRVGGAQLAAEVEQASRPAKA
jgi:hypothetical protein